VDVRQISAAATIEVRLPVLRPGLPPESAVFAGDDDSDTFHAGAYLDGELVSVMSIYRADHPRAHIDGRSEWQVRGAATVPQARRRGLGNALLDLCHQHAIDSGGALAWCNARTEAIDFWTAAGYAITSDIFMIEGVGPHVIMERAIS
jgi:ribosomal protein S18 acetylase RimI-like enzyme